MKDAATLCSSAFRLAAQNEQGASSSMELTDASGAVMLYKGYEPYGEVLYSQGIGARNYNVQRDKQIL